MSLAGGDVLERIDTKIAEPGDHDRFSHYVRKQAILAAAIDGIPAIALCGKKWTPNADPEKFPVCPECKEIIEDDERFLGSDV